MTREDLTKDATGPQGQASLQVTEKPGRKRAIIVLALCALLLGACAGVAYVFLKDAPRPARVSRHTKL